MITNKFTAGMNVRPKKRSINFTKKEETLLIRLIRKYRERLECRQTDKHTNKLKLLTWIQVSNEFNSISGDVFRDHRILRKKYENMKKKLKKDGGGGKSVNCTNADTEITGLPAEFDLESKVIAEEPIVREEKLEKVEFVEFVDETFAQGELEFLDYVDESVSRNIELSPIVDEPVSQENSTPVTSTTSKSATVLKETETTQGFCTQCGKNNVIIDWTSKKSEAHELELQLKQEEHKLKLQLMRERHVHELKLLERESDERIKLMKCTMLLGKQ